MEKSVQLEEAIKIKEDIGYPPSRTPIFNKLGDYLEVFFDDEEYYSDWIDDTLTVFRSLETHELNGCKICNVSFLAQNVSMMMEVKEDRVKLRFLLLNAMGTKPSREMYWNLEERAGELPVEISEMLAAA